MATRRSSLRRLRERTTMGNLDPIVDKAALELRQRTIDLQDNIRKIEQEAYMKRMVASNTQALQPPTASTTCTCNNCRKTQ
jgi:hypothetical protein